MTPSSCHRISECNWSWHMVCSTFASCHYANAFSCRDMRVSDIGNIHIRLTFYPSKAIQSTMKICYNHMFSRLNITTMNPSTQSFVIILFILVFRDSSIKCTNMLWYICIFDTKFRMYYITSKCDTKFRVWCEVLKKLCTWVTPTWQVNWLKINGTPFSFSCF